jgi:serine/threonine-protein kinase
VVTRRAATTDGSLVRTAVQGRNIGPYEIVEVLSEKGHARVLKARDTAMNRMVVLKVLPKNMVDDPQWAERFRREVQLAGQLSHPNIVTAYGASEVDGMPLLAFEYLEGLSLGERLESTGNLAEKTAWLIAREVAKALAYAASKGVLHRNIKPETILCSNSGEVKVMDMGLSKSMSDDTNLTTVGTTVGTPFYISPEQARGTKDLDGRTDIYALGCTTFHMLTGSVPFMGASLLEVMVKHNQAPRPDPRALLPEISAGSTTLVMRMMAVRPDDRPASAAELVTEIDALLPSLPEPEALVRPVVEVRRSETGVLNRAGEAEPAPPKPLAPKGPAVPKPSLFTRLMDWFVNLLD